MKKTALLLIVLIGTFSNSLLAQDTIYFNKENQKVKTATNAYSYEITEQLSNQRAIDKRYFISGGKKSITNYKVIANTRKIPNGNRKVWNKKGQLIENSNYKNGKEHGLQVYYWDNGKIRRKDNFKRGKLKNGECWDKDGNPIEYFPRKIIPKFPGNIVEFIENKLKYPPISRNHNVEGRVLVGFKVDTTGKVVEVKIIKGVNKELNTEALRVVNSMPRWKPGYLEGKLVKVGYTIPIVFRLSMATDPIMYKLDMNNPRKNTFNKRFNR